MRTFWALVACICLTPAAALAQYTQRANVTTAGAITFTGNALGLDGQQDRNAQGDKGAIGTFITTDTTLQDLSPSPGSGTAFPPGTTNDWTLNSSAAMLRLPAGSRVLRAELIWGGSFGDRDENVHAFIDGTVNLTTPDGTVTAISPDGSTGHEDGGGSCSDGCFYVRTADVTALVAAAGPGAYTVGHVPATQGTGDDNNPVAGWTLAVLYEDFAQPIRNLTLFLGLELSGGDAAEVAGFCTPSDGPVSGRLAVSAIEGDAKLTGDQLRFGPTSSLGSSNRLSGGRNKDDNFFAGQITNDAGEIDESGTFGTRNHSPGNAVDGSRQGWDITNVDASEQLQNNQTSAFARGTTDGDRYRITTLGLQIVVGAPRFFNTAAKEVDRATAQVGDILTYTVHVDNTAGTADANNVLFFDPPPAGTSYVAGSLTVDGATVPGADPIVDGVPLGTIARGQTREVTLQVQVTAVPLGPTANIRSNKARWTFDFVSCPGQTPLPGAAESNIVVTNVPVADLSIAKTFLTNPAIPGAPVTYRLLVRNEGPSPNAAVAVADPGTTPALTNVTWSCLPQSGGSTCNVPSGIGPLASTVSLPASGGVVFTVTGTLPASTPAGTLTNTATVAPPPGVPDTNLANNTAAASVPIVTEADVVVKKSGPPTGVLGANVVYTLTVTNNGPSDALGVIVTDPAPAGLTLVSLTGPCSAAPGCTLAPGASQTLMATFTIPPGYAGADPILNVASATSTTTDPKPLNNTGVAGTALLAPVADLSITKTDGVTSVTAGLTTTYTITVANAGPSLGTNSRVVDVFDPAVFSSVQWQCVASGTSTCPAPASGTGNIDALVSVAPLGGNEVVFTVQAVLRPEAVGPVENTATVSPDATVTDPDGGNNSATDTDTIDTLADVSIAKVGPASIVPGTVATYTVTVTNAGPSRARAIPASDRVFDATTAERSELMTGFTAPAGVPCDFRPFTDPLGLRSLVRFCVIPTLDPTESATFMVQVTIPPDFSTTPTSITNTAFIDGAVYVAPDPDTTDYTASVVSAIVPSADIVVTKVGPASVVAGSTVSYFVKVSNDGPSTATNIVITDPLPAGLVIASADGLCAAGYPCTIGSLAPGANSTTRFDVLIPRDYSGPPTFVNTATAASDTSDPNLANNSASVSTLIVREQADLLVEKFGPSVVAPGGQIQYIARLTNLGPGPAVDVTWSDVLPGGTTFVSGTPPAAPTTCTVPSGTSNIGSCLTPTLAVGEMLEFRFIVQTSPDLVPGAELTNVASASTPTPDINAANNRAEVITRVAAATDADVQVTKTDLPDPVVAGGNVTYTILVTNAGPAPATSVSLTDTLPAGLTLVSATPTQGTCTAGTCALGSLAPLATATVTVVATTSTLGRVTNVATVSATETDPIPANNTASQDTTVANATDADLVVEKIGPTILAPGDASYYTIRVTNRGPAPALFVEITDPLPAGVTFVDNSEGCVTAFPCEIEQLDAGASKIIHTALTVDSGVTVPSTVTNTASAASAVTNDPDLSNNSASVNTQLYDAASADLVITKRDSPDPVVAGTEMSYVITVSNRGPATASGVTATDTLPAGVTVVGTHSTQGSCSGTATVVCLLGSMPEGSIAEIEIVATAPMAVPTPNPMVNTASVASIGSADPDSTNNSATAPTTVVARADVSVTKTGPASVVPGTSAVYTITIVNNGPSTASGVGLVDPVPAGLTLSGVGGACTALPCVLGTMAPAESRTVQVMLQVPPDYAAPNPIVNVATVASTSVDPDLANNVATVSTPLGPASADLSMTKTGPPLVAQGRPVLYTLTVTNAGPSTASGVTITDPAPTGLVPGAVSGACAALPCALGTLAPGGTRTVNVSFTVPAGYAGPRPIVNTATVTSSTADPTLSNNIATAMTVVSSGTLCDITGNGIPQFVTGAGPGGGPHVRVWDFGGGTLNEVVHGFFSYDPYFPGGVAVECADVTGDGISDIITGAGPGGGPHVRVWSLIAGVLTEVEHGFFAYDPAFPGGVSVAAADVTGDGIADVITGAGPGGGPHVRVWSYINGALSELAHGFFAYDPFFPGGVEVAAGDVTGDGIAEVITGAGPGGGPHVRVWGYANSVLTDLGGFFAYDPAFPGGVSVAVGDVDGDGIGEIITGAGPGGGPHVRVWKVAGGVLTELGGFFAYDPTFPGGVHVTATDLDGDGLAEIITGAGPGGGPHVRVWSVAGGTLREVFGFFAYDPAFPGGVLVGR